MKELARDVGWYAAGTISAAAISGLLLPVYARFLPPDQLAALVVTQATVAILRILGTLGAPSGMFRYVAGPPEDRAGRPVTALITTTLVFVLGASAVVGGLSLLLAAPVLGNLAGHDAQRLMALAALTAVASGPREIVELVLRAEGRARTWSIYAAVSSALLASSATLAVIAVDPTAEAILVLQLAVLVIIAAAGLLTIGRSLRPRMLSLGELRTILRIGVPTSLNILLDWILHYVDRFILLAFATAGDLGVYSFGSRIGLLVQQVGGAAIQAGWDPYSYRQHRGEGAARRLGSSSTLLLVAVLGQVVILGAAAAPLVVAVGGRPDYLAGAAFVFPIGLAYWLATARYLFTTPFSLRFRPEIALFALGAAAASNIALDLALIPEHGIYGAAIAVVASSLIGAAVALAIGRRYRSIDFEPLKLSLAVAAALLAFVVSAPVALPSPIATLLLRPTVAVVVFGATLALTGTVPSPLRLLRPRGATR